MIRRDTDIRSALRSRQRGFIMDPYRYVQQGYYSSAVLQCHFDGTNGSTTVVDSSSAARTMTCVGDAKITTADSVFGGASLLLDGSGDWVSTPSATALNFGASDFCCEFRFCPAANMNSGTGQTGLVSKWANYPGIEWMVDYVSGVLRLVYTDGSTTYTATYTANFTAGTWYAVAANRSGSTFRLLVDGISRANNANAITIPSTSQELRIGIIGNGVGAFNGKIDELRLLKGVGPRNANYTLDAAAFPNS